MASTPSYALSQLWPSLSGTTSDKIAQVNAMTVAGPNVDIGISQVAGYLLLEGVYPTLVEFSTGSPNSTQPHDGALTAAKTFVAWIALLELLRSICPTPTYLRHLIALRMLS